MNPLDRVPGPYPHGERDGIDVFHVIATFFGIALVLLAVVAVVLLLWNSFKVRSEVRGLRNDIARLTSGGVATGAASAVSGAPATPASRGVNTGALAVPPTPPTPPAAPPTPPSLPATPAAPPTPPSLPATPPPSAPETTALETTAPETKAPAVKTPRAPRKKPTDPVE